MNQYDNVRQGFEVGALLANHAEQLVQNGACEQMQKLRLESTVTNVGGWWTENRDAFREKCHGLFQWACESCDLEAPPIWGPDKPGCTNGGLLPIAEREELAERVATCRKAIYDGCGKYELVASLINWMIFTIYVRDGIHYFN